MSNFTNLNSNMPIQNTPSNNNPHDNDPRKRKRKEEKNSNPECIICLEHKEDVAHRCDTPNCQANYCNSCFKDHLEKTPNNIVFDEDFKFKCPCCRQPKLVPLTMCSQRVTERFFEYTVGITTSSCVCCRAGRLEAVLTKYPYFTTLTDADGCTLMHHSATNGDTTTMEIIAQYGGSYETHDNFDMSPLDLLRNYQGIDTDEEEIYTPDEPIFEAVRSHNDDLVRQMISEMPARLNCRSEADGCPLANYVAMHGSEAIQMEILSNPHTDINVVWNKKTILMHGILSSAPLTRLAQKNTQTVLRGTFYSTHVLCVPFTRVSCLFLLPYCEFM